jgi:hypothetical protein
MRDRGQCSREQYAAQQAVRRATGDVYLRPDYCQRCAVDCEPKGHHFAGYEDRNALKVIWLCNECHGLAHAEMRLDERRRTGIGAVQKRQAAAERLL